MTRTPYTHDPRCHQDGCAPMVLLPGQYLLCSGQTGASRGETWWLLRTVHEVSGRLREAEVRKLRGERN